MKSILSFLSNRFSTWPKQSKQKFKYLKNKNCFQDEKRILHIFKAFSLKQTNRTFMEDESPTSTFFKCSAVSVGLVFGQLALYLPICHIKLAWSDDLIFLLALFYRKLFKQNTIFSHKTSVLPILKCTSSLAKWLRAILLLSLKQNLNESHASLKVIDCGNFVVLKVSFLYIRPDMNILFTPWEWRCQVLHLLCRMY